MPDIHFLSYDPAVRWREMLLKYAEEAGAVLYPGDPRELVLRQLLAYIVDLYAQVDEAARGTLLRYATGEVLEALGEIHDVTRLQAVAATTTLRFTLSAVRAQTIFIPMFTRATNGQGIFFETVEPLSIPAGALFGDVQARCTVVGLGGNGFVPGMINQLVDPVAFVEKVENLVTTAGGADLEVDDALRERIHIAPGKYSVAGSYNAYRYWAMSAHQGIVDVGIRMRVPGVVELTPLMADGQETLQNVIDLVYETCNAAYRRPLTDSVEVGRPERIMLAPKVHYVAPMGTRGAVVEAVEGPGGALETYALWQRERLGRAVNPDRLRMLLVQAGCLRVELWGLEFQALETYQVAMVEAWDVTHEEVDVDA